MSARAPLKVCLVHYYDFDLDNRVQRQAYSLAARGDEVHVVCLTGPRRIPVGAGTVFLHRVDVPKRRGHPLAVIRGYLRFMRLVTARVTAIDRSRRLDLVSVHNTPDFVVGAALWPKLRGVPVILDVHDTFPEFFMETFELHDRHPLMRIIRAEEKLSIAMADAIVAVTETARERLAGRCGAGTDIRVVMNCPDRRAFGPPASPVAIPETGPVRVAYHGGMSRHYGVESLIEGVGLARRRQPRLELSVFGLFGGFDEIRALVERVDPHGIRLCEPIPYAQMHERLRDHHIGAVPTLSDRFTELLLPVKLLEYVHLGMPVATARLDGIVRYFGDDAVACFDAGSPPSIADSLVGLVADPQGALQRAGRAAATLDAMRWEIQEAAYFELIDELVGRRPARPQAQQSAGRSASAFASSREKRRAPLGSRWSPSPKSDSA